MEPLLRLLPRLVLAGADHRLRLVHLLELHPHLLRRREVRDADPLNANPQPTRRDAGGQADGERSAALYVTGAHPYPLFDLRVDVAKEPTGELRKGYDWYKPLAPFYSECYEKGIPAKYKDYLRSIGWPVSPYEGSSTCSM